MNLKGEFHLKWVLVLCRFVFLPTGSNSSFLVKIFQTIKYHSSFWFLHLCIVLYVCILVSKKSLLPNSTSKFPTTSKRNNQDFPQRLLYQQSMNHLDMFTDVKQL